MIPELGHFALILALMTSLVQASLPLVGAARQDRSLMALASFAAVTSFLLVGFAFAALAFAFMSDDFSVQLVAANSQTAKPLIYKLTGVWANHEGSMMLWVLILVIFAALIASFGSNLPAPLKARVLAVQGMIASAFLAFSIFTSNPFARLANAPIEGNGMNPLLQDPGLAIHPPCLYMGYVGFSVAFAFAVAALIEGKVDAAWARWVRPWVLLAWCFLTLGITLGSFWAYYILGWGGWWFWDPVENVSLMPWLLGTALLHSALVVERRHALVGWTLLLAILTFSLSLVGTFVVRSGVLTSVHSFATDPGRGLFILLIIFGFTGGALLLYALRIPQVKKGVPFGIVSREAGLLLNNVFLVVATSTVFFGTFWPLVIDLMGDDKISVGVPYYNLTFVPLFLPVLVTMVVGPFMKWKKDNLKTALAGLNWPLVIAMAVLLLVAVMNFGAHLMTALGIGLAAWIIVGSVWVLVKRVKNWRDVRNTPRAYFGLVLGHMGLGMVLLAITVVTTWQQENILSMKVGDQTRIGSTEVKLAKIETVPGPNYKAERGTFELAQGGNVFRIMTAERRMYPLQQQQTNQTGIHTNLISNTYIALGDADGKGGWTVRLYYHPMAPFLWIGGFIMALGGFVSLSDRRFRVGVAQKARGAVVPASLQGATS
ncbi:heme lyase CcmF/NrfE family subunit [Aestuariivirga litoralis]|uniref:heme lyase CcmF/NrfE family subunit n=1 Tax=Aestuariivirga litoralis TaxID=2650924 RepID=UPI0018C6F6EC|nr:heme lyase CcmF/NrfE family subunit [Aestuariivirga litoralis]MBG1232440.1 heme lyase CcmF/NrfE family subunit [Aestuariivirga litoralis]